MASPSLHHLLACFFLVTLHLFHSSLSSTTRFYEFKVQHTRVRKLCSDRSIITVNGRFPGPTIYAQEGDRVIVKVINTVSENVTIHWHGVRQQFSCWSDGAAYVTQCPIQSGRSYTYEFTIYQQRGSMFWHAHVNWLKATVHGAIVVYPIRGMPYPFPFPFEEHVLILGEYWSSDLKALEMENNKGMPAAPDAYTINGHPGPLYSCSQKDTYSLKVLSSKTYLLRIINAGLNVQSVFGISNHELTVVAVDGSYVKPFKTYNLALSSGQTADVLLTADQETKQYAMAVGPYIFDKNAPINHALALSILEYEGSSVSSSPNLDLSSTILERNGTGLMLGFMSKLRSFSIAENNLVVPDNIDRDLFYTIGINNINSTFNPSSMAILQSYYYGQDHEFYRNEVFNDIPDFSSRGSFAYADKPVSEMAPTSGIPVYHIPFNSNVQMVLQDTSLTTATEDHPVHLHGHSFYVVGYGLGKYHPGSTRFNLVDPPLRNTVAVPGGGWAVIRFRADNPGVWLMHCHYQSHLNWGFSMALIVRDGKNHTEVLPPPPADLPEC